ncbi:MAG: polysaccharide biosynthesis/export family protein [Candidatus Omnitrophota bacterium]|jgi:polysaccharide export outer membrane protein
MLDRVKKIVFVLLMSGMVVPCIYGQDDHAQEQAREHYLKGNLYYQQGKFQEAQAEFNNALGLLNQKEETPAITFQDKQAAQTAAGEPMSLEQPLQPPVAKNLNAKKKPLQEYTIGEDDVLHILVWQNQDLDQEVVVRPDGKISFPLIGDVDVVGLTITELDALLTERLKEYVKHPEVSISIKKIGGQKVLLLGEIYRPGVYSLTGAKTIVEAITLAGGLTKDAVASSIVIIRGGLEKPEVKRITLNKVLKGDANQNISLVSEDIIFVPKKFIANLNYFLSQILEPLSRGSYVNQEIQKF